MATKLGDLTEDIVVAGGLVPALLIDQEALPPGGERHPGTLDLDVGLALALLDAKRYQELAERLRRAGFSPDVNDQGNPAHQRWKVNGAQGPVTIDFLIEPTREGDRGGTLRNLEQDLAAVITPGLRLAFRDRQRVTLSGHTVFGERATRSVWVCGPGAFVVLKAIAMARRGENKDAFDLYYVVRNFGAGTQDVVAAIRPLLGEPETQEALAVLRRDFLDRDGVGPRRTAVFISGAPDDNIQADVVGFVRRLLAGLGAL